MPSYLEQFEGIPVEDRWPLVRRWMFSEPLPFFAELHAHRPVLETTDVTLAFSFADCTEILRNFDTFSVALYRAKQGDYWMAQDDTATHWREKSIMYAILDREDIPSIRGYVGKKAADLLAAAGGSMDAVVGLTRAVPLALVQDWFGFVDGDPAELCRWSYWNQMDAFWNQPFDVVTDPAKVVAERESANEAMRTYLIALVQRRLGEIQAGKPSNDPVTRLLQLAASRALRFDGPRVVLNVGGLLVGAVETTSHAVVNALDFLMKQPDILAKARVAAMSEDPRAVDGFVFEALRFRPAFPYFFRLCERDTVLSRGTDHERLVKKGTTVLAVTHAAMFDPKTFSNVNDFAPDRGITNSFHFGFGLHECLGRAIGQVLIPEIVRQSLRLQNLNVSAVDRRGGPVPESWLWQWN